jgi:hypothetical protein
MSSWLETGCWRDLPDDPEGMRTCEADPDPSSALGLCAEHEGHIKLLSGSAWGGIRSCIKLRRI